MSTGYSKIKPKRGRGGGIKHSFSGVPANPLKRKSGGGGGGGHGGKKAKGGGKEKKNSTPQMEITLETGKELEPYQSKLFPEISLEGITPNWDGKHRVFISFPQPTKFDLIAFSEYGLNISARGKPYISLMQRVTKGQNFTEKSLGHYLKHLDFWSWDAYKTVEHLLKEEWGPQIGAGDTRITLTGGWSDWERNAKDRNVADITLFPHLQWTDCFENNKKKKTIEEIQMSTLFANSAISTFLFNNGVQRLEVALDPTDMTSIRVTPWMNTKVLTWVNVGQNCKKALEEIKAKKEAQKKQERVAGVQALVDLLNEESTTPVETIPPSGESDSTTVNEEE